MIGYNPNSQKKTPQKQANKDAIVIDWFSAEAWLLYIYIKLSRKEYRIITTISFMEMHVLYHHKFLQLPATKVGVFSWNIRNCYFKKSSKI